MVNANCKFAIYMTDSAYDHEWLYCIFKVKKKHTSVAFFCFLISCLC